MACGLEHYAVAIFMTLFVSFLVILLHFFRNKLTAPKRDIFHKLIIELHDYAESKEKLESLLHSLHVSFELLSLDEKESGVILTYDIRFRKRLHVDILAAKIKETLNEKLTSFRWGNVK